jgi:hypothetical protein
MEVCGRLHRFFHADRYDQARSEGNSSNEPDGGVDSEGVGGETCH